MNPNGNGAFSGPLLRLTAALAWGRGPRAAQCPMSPKLPVRSVAARHGALPRPVLPDIVPPMNDIMPPSFEPEIPKERKEVMKPAIATARANPGKWVYVTT